MAKFMEKGYPKDLFLEAFESCLEDRPTNMTNIRAPPKNGARVITGFNNNYRMIASVMRKHQHILQIGPGSGSPSP